MLNYLFMTLGPGSSPDPNIYYRTVLREAEKPPSFCENVTENELGNAGNMLEMTTKKRQYRLQMEALCATMLWTIVCCYRCAQPTTV